MVARFARNIDIGENVAIKILDKEKLQFKKKKKIFELNESELLFVRFIDSVRCIWEKKKKKSIMYYEELLSFIIIIIKLRNRKRNTEELQKEL